MKTKNIKIGIVAALSGLATAQNCDAQTDKSTNTGSQNADNIRVEQKLNYISAESSIKELLGKLSQTGIIMPSQEIVGAMCYGIVAPKRINFVSRFFIDRKYDKWVLHNISEIEEIVSEMKTLGYDIVLDKTEFLRKNKKNIKEPKLIFKIRFSDEADYHVVRSNIENEYHCLLEFLSNPDEFSDMANKLTEYYSLTIQKMTGLGEDLKIKKQ